MNTREKIESMGGARAVARMLGISSPAVSQWKKIPIQRAIEIEIRSKGKFSRVFCRPDVFGPLAGGGENDA